MHFQLYSYIAMRKRKQFEAVAVQRYPIAYQVCASDKTFVE